MDDPKTEDRSDKMERDLHQLEDHIADSEKKLEPRKKDADAADDVAGESEGEQDRGGDDDPSGAADPPDAETDTDERADEELENPT